MQGDNMTTPSQYFADHPEARNDVTKAWYAYLAPHFLLTADGHNFTSTLRESRCVWCGRSREMVRWDDLPPACHLRPPIPGIADCIKCEESVAFRLIDKAADFVGSYIAANGLSGATLAKLHHTHGYDPETVAAFFPINHEQMSDYQSEMEMERAKSRGARKPEQVIVKTP